MALINRISRLFKADFHAVLDQIEEPEQQLKQAIRDMEDDLTATEQRIRLCANEQEALSLRKSQLETALAEIDGQLDLCFESGEDELAKKLIRKKLEAGRLLRHLKTKHAANERYLASHQAVLDENRVTLEGMKQKADLFAQRAPSHFNDRSSYDDIDWMAQEMKVGDDEVEVAWLQEKSRRSAS